MQHVLYLRSFVYRFALVLLLTSCSAYGSSVVEPRAQEPRAQESRAQERQTAEVEPRVAPQPPRPLALSTKELERLAGPSLEHIVDKWRPDARRCAQRGRRRFCDGPRRVPVSVGLERERRDYLELGLLRSAAEAIRAKVRPEWLEAIKQLNIEPPIYPLTWPVEGGRFGRGVGTGRSRFRVHRGVDVTAEVGTPVHVVASGLVLYADNGVPGYGNLLVVLHGGGQVSTYAHLSEVRVAAGAVVNRGDVVAVSGNTGISRGPHLHFEWREAGNPADPMRRMAADHVPPWLLSHFESHPPRRRRKRRSH